MAAIVLAGGGLVLAVRPGSVVGDSTRMTARATPRPSVASEPIRPTLVAVAVPAIAVIRVDESGRVVAAMTNTASPPRPTDETWLMRPDGSMQPAAVERFTNYQWTGDFSAPGVYVDQHG